MEQTVALTVVYTGVKTALSKDGPQYKLQYNCFCRLQEKMFKSLCLRLLCNLNDDLLPHPNTMEHSPARFVIYQSVGWTTPDLLSEVAKFEFGMLTRNTLRLVE